MKCVVWKREGVQTCQQLGGQGKLEHRRLHAIQGFLKEVMIDNIYRCVLLDQTSRGTHFVFRNSGVEPFHDNRAEASAVASSADTRDAVERRSWSCAFTRRCYARDERWSKTRARIIILAVRRPTIKRDPVQLNLTVIIINDEREKEGSWQLGSSLWLFCHARALTTGWTSTKHEPRHRGIYDYLQVYP
jgi:hypothetical protein